MPNCNKRKLELILESCKKKFGKSRYKKEYPKISLCTKKNTSDMGWYDESNNIIRIYINHYYIKTYKDIISTVLHEYKHYLLDTKQYTKIFYDLINKNPKLNDNKIRDLHPHEIKCEEFEIKWRDEFYEELKHELHKRK
jgi:hypothetical protein